MIYDLRNPIDRQKATDKFQKLLDDKDVIELKKKMNRTPKQNNYLHLILTWFSLEYGCSLDYAKKNYYKELSKDIYVVKKVVKSGREIDDLRSSADLDSAEMTITIDRFRNWSGQNGIYLPSPDEKEFLKEIQIQESRNRY